MADVRDKNPEIRAAQAALVSFSISAPKCAQPISAFSIVAAME